MKVSLPTPSNAYCPQTFYTFGTYKEDGSPNFGLFCWLSYCWDGELCVMACIGGEKMTNHYVLDSFGMVELIESSVLLYGNDIRTQLKAPEFSELYADVKYHIIKP